MPEQASTTIPKVTKMTAMIVFVFMWNNWIFCFD
jgi:hypothetical protein